MREALNYSSYFNKQNASLRHPKLHVCTCMARGVEWRKFQLIAPSSEQYVLVKGPQKNELNFSQNT